MTVFDLCRFITLGNDVLSFEKERKENFMLVDMRAVARGVTDDREVEDECEEIERIVGRLTQVYRDTGESRIT
jgi:hypothetical protein